MKYERWYIENKSNLDNALNLLSMVEYMFKGNKNFFVKRNTTYTKDSYCVYIKNVASRKAIMISYDVKMCKFYVYYDVWGICKKSIEYNFNEMSMFKIGTYLKQLK